MCGPLFTMGSADLKHPILVSARNPVGSAVGVDMKPCGIVGVAAYACEANKAATTAAGKVVVFMLMEKEAVRVLQKSGNAG